MAKHWSQVSESGAVIGMRFLFFVYRYLGRWAFNLCLYPVIVYFFLVKTQARKASLDYLARLRHRGLVAPQTSMLWLSFRHFLQFGRGLLDKLAAWTGAFNYQNVVLHQRRQFLQMVERKSGALVIVSHLGNQEICRSLAEQSRPFKLNILVHTRHAEKFNRLIAEVDKNDAVKLLQVADITPATAILLKQKIDDGEVIVIAGDRTPVTGGRTTQADFLGDAALFPQGPYILASVLQCPVYLLFSVRGRRGYEVFFEPFAERIHLQRKQREQDVQYWAQRFADRLAHYTGLYPLQWNNFYDFWHRDAGPHDQR